MLWGFLGAVTAFAFFRLMTTKGGEEGSAYRFGELVPVVVVFCCF